MDLWLPPHDFRVRSLKKLNYGFTSTPLGDCLAVSTDSHLVALYFSENRHNSLTEFQKQWPTVELIRSTKTEALIQKAFHNPDEIPVMAVGTPFQLTVWEFLRTIPSASTITYGELASAIGHPKAARAVGRAVGANEISVAIPCHRIVSKNSLTGYRWGLERKQQLLARELAKKDPLKMPF